MSKTKNHTYKSVQLSRHYPRVTCNNHLGVSVLGPNPFILVPAQFRSTLTLAELEWSNFTTTLTYFPQFLVPNNLLFHRCCMCVLETDSQTVRQTENEYHL